ncbi:MAG: LptF/LptG family permease [Planctomycetes bacterium]|nr:LptF/LptG family permease [Planctomycetota bacterium]
MRVLDNYLFKKSLFALICILTVTVFVVLFFDMIFNIDKLLLRPIAQEDNRWNLIFQFYLMRIPSIVTSVLPFTMMSAALVTCAPMLRKNEFTALGASGISPQQICRVLFFLALFCGITQYTISNHLNPLVYNHNSHVETALGRGGNPSKTWKNNDNDSIWFAADSRIFNDEKPSFKRVYIVAANGDIVYAQRMIWIGKKNRWKLQAPIIHWQTQGEHSVQELTNFKLAGPFALEQSPYEIQQELLTREALTASELFDTGEHMHLSLFLNRCLALVVPLLALCYGLPYFARFKNRQQILVASTKALTLAAVPVLIISLTGMASDASSWSPWLSNSIGLFLACIPAVILMRRWHY